MPIYEFKCEDCDIVYEEQKSYDDFESNCPSCNKTARKIMSAASFSVNGTTNRKLDSLVGEVSEKRWMQIEENKNKRIKNNFGNVTEKEAKIKDSQRIKNIISKQNTAYNVIEKAKKDAGITKKDEIRHITGGNDA